MKHTNKTKQFRISVSFAFGFLFSLETESTREKFKPKRERAIQTNRNRQKAKDSKQNGKHEKQFSARQIACEKSVCCWQKIICKARYYLPTTYSYITVIFTATKTRLGRNHFSHTYATIYVLYMRTNETECGGYQLHIPAYYLYLLICSKPLILLIYSFFLFQAK